jgi:hypothetical protein
MPRLRPSALAPLTLLASLALAAPASAAQRYTTPDATLTSGPCPATSPCQIDVAVNQAVAGDEVVVAPGTYSVGTQLDPVGAIDLHGVAGQPRPRLLSTPGATSALLSFKTGGTVRHLRIDATGPAQDAVTLQGVVADDLILLSDTGDGGKIVGSASTTVLRDSIVRTASSGDGAAGLKLRTSGAAGDVALRNLTVLAPSGIGVRCELTGGHATIVNSIVRGRDGDVAVTRSGADCAATYSNLRPAMSPGLPVGAGNQQADPAYADPNAGDYRPAVGSPTIDAGTADSLLGPADPAGCARTLGLAPDIGAYEYADPTAPCAAAAPELVGSAAIGTPAGHGEDDDTSDDTPSAVVHDVIRGVPAPVVGRTIVVAPGQGKVLVRRPGSTRFRKVGDSTNVPVGSVLDARSGRVKLVSVVDAEGHLQLATFWGAKFEVRQQRRGSGTIVLRLRGGDFSACHTAQASRGMATMSRKRHRRVRSLWGTDSHGRYRTYGQNSAATARGTRWLTEDRCDGTLTRVTSGAVSVRDHVHHRTVLVRAGHSYLARAR